MIAIGCDHGGYALKQEVMRHLDELGLAYKDFGTYSEESCDYPIYGEAVARAVRLPVPEELAAAVPGTEPGQGGVAITALARMSVQALADWFDRLQPEGRERRRESA